MGMEFRPYYLSREWVKAGHNVTIIAASYSHLRKTNPTVAADFSIEVIDGIEYCWLKTDSYVGNGVQRAITMGQFVSKLLANSRMIANRWNPDIVIASSTYPLDAYPAKHIAKLANAKYIHEVHDMWPATLYEIGGMSKLHPFVVVMQIAENYAYKHCNRCVSLLPYSKDYMVRHGLAPDKFVNIQNGVVEDEWDNPEDLPEEHLSFFKEHKGSFIVGYFGGHALSNALDSSLDVAKRFLSVSDDIIFVFVGDGVEKKRLVSRVNNEHISNSFFLPPVPKKAIPNLIKYFDCSYMTGLSSPLYKYGLCLNKMYDSMMAGVPIVCAIDAPKTLVSEYDCGIECDPSNIEDVMNSIQKIVSLSPEQRNRIGENGRKAILDHFTYGKLAHEFIESI